MEKKVKINGTTWVMKIVSTEEIQEIRDDGEYAALTNADDKIIYFDKDEIDLAIVSHELFHAYASDLHLRDTHDFSLADIEEIFACMFAEKAEKIVRQARRIYKTLMKLKESNDQT